jgi:hypothetical protein
MDKCNNADLQLMVKQMLSSVIVPRDYLSEIHVDQKSLVESVADSIAASLGIRRVDQWLAHLWDADEPDGTGHLPLSTYLEEVRKCHVVLVLRSLILVAMLRRVVCHTTTMHIILTKNFTKDTPKSLTRLHM